MYLPKTPNYGMSGQAARMAAEAAPIKGKNQSPYPSMGAPIVPTSNLRPSGGGSGLPVGPPQGAFNEDDAADAARRQQFETHYDPTQTKNAARIGAQQNQAGLNARLGASGFGTSGAAAALSGNVQADLARQLASLDLGADQFNLNAQNSALANNRAERQLTAQEAAQRAAVDAFIENNKPPPPAEKNGWDQIGDQIAADPLWINEIMRLFNGK